MCNKIIRIFIDNFKKGDVKAFDIIYKVFEKLIRLYAGRLFYEDGIAELDLFLIELLYKIDLDKFDSNDNSFTIQKYMAVSIRNRYLDLLKKSIERTQNTLPLADMGNRNEEYYYEKIMLPQAFLLLSKKQKDVIKNKYIYGYNDCEISKMMGTTRQAVNGIKRRAIKILKDYYEQ